VLQSVRTLSGEGVIRGQYAGYRNEPGVAPDSLVETFAAMTLHLDSWRWGGVPFFLRTGKSLAQSATEVLVDLKAPPQAVFGDAAPTGANYVRFRLGPDRVAIAIGARAKRAGADMVGREIELFVCNGSEDEMSAYERLIGDALRGDPTLFTREDAVLEAWRIVDPVLRLDTRVASYAPGSFGPTEADGIGRRLDRPIEPC